MAAIYTKRLKRELLDLQKAPPEGISVIKAEDLALWTLSMNGRYVIFRISLLINKTRITYIILKSAYILFYENFQTYIFLFCIGIDYSAGTLYANQRFVIQFKFPKSYPLESPEVIFVGSQIPIHPHIYSNGHICLSILYDQWSPALKVSTVCLSVLSMLSSCTKKEPPSDDKSYVISASKSPKDSVWDFHDESV